MNSIAQPYDPDLQMWTVTAREPNMATLKFWRWLGLSGRLEHKVEENNHFELWELDCNPDFSTPRD